MSILKQSCNDLSVLQYCSDFFCCYLSAQSQVYSGRERRSRMGSSTLSKTIWIYISCFWSMENAPEFELLKDSFLGDDKGMGAWRTQCPALVLEVLVLAFPVIALLDRILLICGFGEGLGNPVRSFFYILRFGAISMRIVVVVC